MEGFQHKLLALLVQIIQVDDVKVGYIRIRFDLSVDVVTNIDRVKSRIFGCFMVGIIKPSIRFTFLVQDVESVVVDFSVNSNTLRSWNQV